MHTMSYCGTYCCQFIHPWSCTRLPLGRRECRNLQFVKFSIRVSFLLYYLAIICLNLYTVYSVHILFPCHVLETFNILYSWLTWTLCHVLSGVQTGNTKVGHRSVTATWTNLSPWSIKYLNIIFVSSPLTASLCPLAMIQCFNFRQLTWSEW